MGVEAVMQGRPLTGFGSIDHHSDTQRMADYVPYTVYTANGAQTVHGAVANVLKSQLRANERGLNISSAVLDFAKKEAAKESRIGGVGFSQSEREFRQRPAQMSSQAASNQGRSALQVCADGR